MRILAIDCATPACSAAVFENGDMIGGLYQDIGRGHAERLIPMIEELPDKGRAEQIRVSLGPGSFTGVRIGLAAARALGVAWQAQVLGYPTLALVAAMARLQHPAQQVTVCMAAGHGEWFMQDFDAEGLSQGEQCALNPAQARARANHAILAGSTAKECLEGMSNTAIALDILPDARQALCLPASLLTADLSLIYGRAPDAKLPGGISPPEKTGANTMAGHGK